MPFGMGGAARRFYVHRLAHVRFHFCEKRISLKVEKTDKQFQQFRWLVSHERLIRK